MNADNKILIVEDDSTLMMVVSLTLRRMKIQFDAATSGEQALELVRDNEYELILMDGKLPGMSGCESTIEIRRIERELGRRPATIFGVTASDNEFDCISAGMNGWYQKPAQYADIVKSFIATMEPIAS